MNFTRKEFLKTFPLLLTSNLFSNSKIFASNENPIRKMKLIKPRRLRKGDNVGIISPAGNISEKELEDIKNLLTNLGFNPVPSKNVLSKYGYLAGSDEERVKDIHEMFSRKDIHAIICARGGYGTPRILPLLDYQLIRSNPKIIIGYSDITSLLIAIYLKSKIVTFHGPVGISTFNDFSLKYFNEVLIEGRDFIDCISEIELQNGEENSINGILTIVPGKVEGELIGGNLSLLINHLGTDFDFDLNGKILFLEEVGEEPYRIDRMLTHLINAHKFDNCFGIALGTFSKCEKKKINPSFENSLTLREVLIDRLSSLNIPTVYGLSFGHIKNKFPLPIGIKVMLDADNGKMTLLESAVE
ncbi:MAG: LD-carboxypeptidase [Ignavibacteria bacterium]|nr:LD-carboxypeptidase [Ignavibacteria bacterium]